MKKEKKKKKLANVFLSFLMAINPLPIPPAQAPKSICAKGEFKSVSIVFR